jgi:peptidoglycan hydrolase-like protein with peptidoglycan-binding domain
MARSPGHAKRGPQRPAHAALPWLLVCLVAVLAGAAATTGVVMSRPHPTLAAAVTTRGKVQPLTVVSTSPTAGSASVATGTTLAVTVSTPLSPFTPPPTLSPPLAGNWVLSSPTVLDFMAQQPLLPGSTETLTVPGGADGLLGAEGQRLAASTSVPFSVGPGTTLRLQQLLAQLGYLPVSFTPSAPIAPGDLAATQAGSFAWRWTGLPAALTSQWVPGTFGVITRGAVMRFETVHGMTTTATIGAGFWKALLAAAEAGSADPDPYDYVYVSETLPETATVYRDGSVAYRTLANTGIPAAPTTQGTYPVYLRYVTTTMSGTNPTGSHYSDPDIPWVSYFHGGDALHGFIRGTYGWPQSLGCVEMPPSNAAVVWPMTPIGTLVTVA